MEILHDRKTDDEKKKKMMNHLIFVVQSLSRVWLFATLWTADATLFCPSLSPGICSNSCPLSQWCSLSISSWATPFSFYLQSFQASGSFAINQLLASSGQKYWRFNLKISPSSEYSGLISFRIDLFDVLAVQGTLKSLSSTIIQKHQFFGSQPSLWSRSYIHMWVLEKP